MKFYIIFLTLISIYANGNIWAQTAPTGSDNVGGVSCPAGTFNFSPTVDQVGLNPYTANATRVVNDLSVASVSEVGLNFVRYYNSRGNAGSPQMGNGGGWRHSYQWDFTVNTVGGTTTINVIYPNGTQLTFTQTSPFVWTCPSPATDVITPYGSGGTAYTLTTYKNIQYVFSSITAFGKTGYNLIKITDSKGLTTNLTYSAANGSSCTTTVTEPGGRNLILYFSATCDYINNHAQSPNYNIVGVTSSDGRTVNITYTSYEYQTGSGSTWCAYSTWCPNQVTYTDNTAATYTYSTLQAQGPSSLHGFFALSQAIDARAVGLPNIKYTYFTGSTDPFGAVQTVTEGVSSTTVCTLSLKSGNAQTPQVVFPDGSTYVYNVNSGSKGGLLASVTNPLGNSVSFTYATGSGTWTTTITDPNSCVYSSVYTTDGFLLSQTLPATGTESTGPTRYWNYNTAGYLTSSIDLMGRTTTYTRDPTTNLVTSISYPDSTSESFTYNSYGEVLTRICRNGGTEYFTYDATGLLLTTRNATQSASQLTTLAYNSNYRVASSTDANGHQTKFQYNDMGEMTLITHPDTTTRSFGYGPALLNSVTDELGHTSSISYDGFNRVVAQFDNLNRETQYTYGASTPTNTRPILVSLPNGKQIAASYTAAWGYKTASITSGYGTADAATTSYGFDPVGNVTSVTDPRSNTYHFGYDQRNRKSWATDPVPNESMFYYDDCSNLLSVVTPDGTTANTYDKMNRLTQTNDPKNQITKETYDNEDSLKTYTDPNSKVYNYTYDLEERQLSMVYPDTTTEAYAYDPVGNMATYTTRDSRIKTPTYDNRNRCTGYTWSDGVTPSVTLGYDAASRLTSASNANSALSYTYDNANEALSETQNVTGLGSKTVSYAYNTDGTLNTLTYPDSTVITRGYDNRNDLTSVSQGGTNVVTYGYDGNGNRTGKTLANGVASTLTYDTAERLTSITDLTPVPTAGTLLQKFQYGYDAMSRLTYVKRDNAKGDVYSYDATDQVIGVKYGCTNPDTTPTSPSRSVGYTLDAAGNRTSVQDSANGTSSYTVNSDNQYTSVGASTLTYDGRGNLATGNGWTYGYDADGRLLSATSTGNTCANSYDPLGRCVKRVQNGVTTYYTYDLGWFMLADYNSSGTQTDRYVGGAGGDEILTRTDSSSTVIYYHNDGQGNVTKLTSSTGAVLEQYGYDIYGAATIRNPGGYTISSSAYGNRFLFAGREYLASTGLYNYRNRDYSPSLGRFLQPDPIRHAGDAYNIYRFCANNPVNFADPSGLTTTVTTPPQDGTAFADSRGLLWRWNAGTGSFDPLSVYYPNLDGNPNPLVVSYPDNGPYTVGGDTPPSPGIGETGGGVSSNGGGGGGAGSGIQAALGLASLIPGPVGEVASGVSATIYLSQGDYTDAGIAAVGIIIPGAAILGRAAKAAEVIDEGALVVRGGENSVTTLTRAIGTHPSGVVGVSVESRAGASVEELAAGLPHSSVGVTTVGAVRAAGGDVVRTTGRSANHATMTGLSPEEMNGLFDIIPNPARQ